MRLVFRCSRTDCNHGHSADRGGTVKECLEDPSLPEECASIKRMFFECRRGQLVPCLFYVAVRVYNRRYGQSRCSALLDVTAGLLHSASLTAWLFCRICGIVFEEIDGVMAQRLVNDKGASPVLHWVSRIQRTVSRNGMNCARVLWTAVLGADAHCAGRTSPLYTHDMAWMSAKTTEFPWRPTCGIWSFACRETHRGRDRGCLVIQTLA